MTVNQAMEGVTVEPPARFGVVLSGTGGVWQVRLDDGATVDAALRGRLKRVREADDDGNAPLKLAVGDEVEVERDQRGEAWAIIEIRRRRSALRRREPSGRMGERVIVANLDQVVIVFAAANPEPHPRMLDRFLVIAEANDIAARIVINKVEITGETAARERFADYIAAGYPMHFTSAKQEVGLAELHAALDGATSALSGPSGVGKSSLMNALYPGLNLRVGEISESVNKGRHTTVGAVLIPLPRGGYLADTPGLREVGVWGLRSESLDDCFPEFRPFMGECRFADCEHESEPECAVRDAVTRGAISAARYDSYRRLRVELEETERRFGPHYE